jgi:hydroxymethylglutaryl-CoA lyase
VSRTLPSRVTIREVGPRDGLQAEEPLPIEARVRLIEALSATGVSMIEAVSFVSPRAVPAMAGTAEVWARVEKRQGVEYSALVPNRRGAEAAVEAGGFASLQAFTAASDRYSLKNVGVPVDQSIDLVREVIAVGTQAGLPVEVSISTVFGDPDEGPVSPGQVLAVARRVVDEGAVGISLGDTTGLGSPSVVSEIVALFREELPAVRLNLHLHDTHGNALANALAALDAGVTEFDTSVGGLGGSPFAPGANGNLATEDFVRTLVGMRIETGIDLDRLRDAADLAESLVGHPLPSRGSAPA